MTEYFSCRTPVDCFLSESVVSKRRRLSHEISSTIRQTTCILMKECSQICQQTQTRHAVGITNRRKARLKLTNR